jgi:hypothetical protein
MPSSGMLRSLALVRAESSGEHIASITMVTRIGELETLAVTSIRSSETSVPTRAIRRNIVGLHFSQSPPWKPETLQNINRLGTVVAT